MTFFRNPKTSFLLQFFSLHLLHLLLPLLLLQKTLKSMMQSCCLLFLRANTIIRKYRRIALGMTSSQFFHRFIPRMPKNVYLDQDRQGRCNPNFSRATTHLYRGVTLTLIRKIIFSYYYFFLLDFLLIFLEKLFPLRPLLQDWCSISSNMMQICTVK